MGTGAAWSVGNCAIAMPATTGAGGNGLKVAEIENLEIAATGVDPMAAQYPGAHSTHTCGMYLAQWPQWSEFGNIDIRGLNTGIAIPALPETAPAGLTADSNRWQNITIQATHAFTADAGCNGVLDNLEAMAGNSSATGEAPTGLVLDLPSGQQGWTVRNAVVTPAWNAAQPRLTVTVAGGAVTGVTVGAERGLGWDPYGTTVPLAFSGSCTAQATAGVNARWVNWERDGGAGRGGLLGDHDGERERSGDLGYGGSGKPGGWAEHDVFRREPAEGQRRVHGVERERRAELRDAVEWRRRAAAGRGKLSGAGGEQQRGIDAGGGPVSGRGLRGEAGSVFGRGEHELWRDVRRAEFHGCAVDGRELDDCDGEHNGIVAVRDDHDDESDRGDGGDAERGATRVRAAGRKRGKWKPGRNGVCVFGRRGDGAGGRPDVRHRYARLSHG